MSIETDGLPGVGAVLTVLFAPIAWAESTEDYYTEQLEESGAADLPEQLPQETQHTLEELGIDGRIGRR